MATSDRRPSRLLLRLSWLQAWHAILAVSKGLVVMTVAFVTVMQLWGSDSNAAGRLNSILVIVLSCASLAYLLFVSSRVWLDLPGIDEGAMGLGGEMAPPGARGLLRGASRRHAEDENRKGLLDEVVTIQVPRLSSDLARVTVVNDAPLPVLRAETTLELVHEAEGGGAHATGDVRRAKGTSFSMRARSVQPTVLPSAFNHVGIFRLRSASVRVYSLLGLLSRVRGIPGEYRVRVVPNIYRLPVGIPRERKAMQDSLGLPEAPADALDYDRVRDYQPGDPLKTIHWKLVAHSQGELFTKLFETPMISTMTLVIDPFGAQAAPSSPDAAYHMHDTMLEGGFSLAEHARENGVAGSLRFANRDGSLVEMPWDGPATLGGFVETASRPSQGAESQDRSLRAIRSLQEGHAGYVIFATSGLTAQSVEALIACHHAGVPLLVVHALPAHPQSDRAQQKSFDARLRDALIGVVELDDGPQILREVVAS